MDNVIVTGSGTGLGRKTSLYLAKKGFAVYATVPDPSQAKAMKALAHRENISNLQVLILDITDQENISYTVKRIHEETGGPFALINNAGIALRGFFEDLSEDEIRRLFEINVFGTMAVTRAVLPFMRASRRGRIITITSIGGRIGSMGISTYIAAKFAQEGFCESLYQELLPLGIHVVIVEPAITNTERWGIHRGIAQGAKNPGSPYYEWFQRFEAMANYLVNTTPTRPEHIAKTVHHALTTRRPRLRYMVGRRARLVYILRCYLPEKLFEQIYFGQIIRRVTNIRRGKEL